MSNEVLEHDTKMFLLIEEHYKTNKDKLVKLFSFRSGNEEMGEDIVQEAYYRALKYCKSCQEGSFKQWFNQILHNAFLYYKNIENGHPTDSIEEDYDEELPCALESRQTMREVYDLINTKSLVQIEVLTHYFRNEYSAKDISEITEYSYSQCHQIIQRFRNELKDLYK